MASAFLKEKLFLKRVFEVAIGDEQRPFVVTYDARALGSECISVDGTVAVRLWSVWWFNRHFDFRLDGRDASIDVLFWPWFAVRSFSLTVGDDVLYREG